MKGFADYGDPEQLAFVADHALQFMIRGLATNYKQPIAYYYTASAKGLTPSRRLSNLIENVIRAVNSTGLKVVHAVCDQAPTNRKAFQILKEKSFNVPEQATYFLVDGSRVFYTYDVPHIMKCLRNNIMGNWQIRLTAHPSSSKYDYPGDMMTWGTGEEKRACRWRHLILLFKAHVKNFKNGKQLEESVIFPGSYEKMRVKYAATAFSASMARNLREHAHLLADISSSDNKTILDTTIDEINETAFIIDELNEMIDYTNGVSSKNAEAHAKEYVILSSDHIEKWMKFKKLTRTMEFFNSNGSAKNNHVPTIKGLEHTLSAFQDLWNYLKVQGFTQLRLRNLNQDPVENFFSLVRHEGGDSTCPTVEQYDATYKILLVTRYANIKIKGTNCTNDEGEMLVDANELFHKLKAKAPTHNESESAQNMEEFNGESPPRLQLREEDEAINEEHRGCETYIMKNLMETFRKSRYYLCNLCSSGIAGSNAGQYSEKFSDYFETMLSEAKKIFYAGGDDRLCSRNMRDRNLFEMIAQCDTNWIQCVEHGGALALSFFKRLITILTKERCDEIVNIVARRNENRSANSRKISQQASKAKWYYFYQY